MSLVTEIVAAASEPSVLTKSEVTSIERAVVEWTRPSMCASPCTESSPSSEISESVSIVSPPRSIAAGVLAGHDGVVA
eukprot:5178319-Prymnesium_polylepis.1